MDLIKIDLIRDQSCNIRLRVQAIRPHHIPEEKLGKDVVKNREEFYFDDDGHFYMSVDDIPTNYSIEKLMQMQVEAQESFSLAITKLKRELDAFKRLQKLVKEV